jgi:hypothetical protein
LFQPAVTAAGFFCRACTGLLGRVIARRAAFIAVHIVSGAGKRNAHWSKTWAGGQNETMTGFLHRPTFLRNTSIQSFADIGYTTAAPAAVPLCPTLAMLLGGLGALGVARARRRQPKCSGRTGALGKHKEIFSEQKRACFP